MYFPGISLLWYPNILTSDLAKQCPAPDSPFSDCFLRCIVPKTETKLRITKENWQRFEKNIHNFVHNVLSCWVFFYLTCDSCGVVSHGVPGPLEMTASCLLQGNTSWVTGSVMSLRVRWQRGSKCSNDWEQSGHSNHEYWIGIGTHLHRITHFLFPIELGLLFT